MASKKVDWLKRTDRGWMAKPEVIFQGPNPRTVFDEKRLAVLKEQIRRDGVREPLLVRRQEDGEGGFLEVFDGERRMRCVNALIAEGVDIPWVRVNIEKANTAELMLRAAQSVEGKEKLDAMDESNLVKQLIGHGVSKKKIAEGLGHKSTGWVTQREQLQSLIPVGQKALRAGSITLTRALDISRMSEKKQAPAIKKDVAGKAKGKKGAGKAAPKKPGKKAVKKLCEELEASEAHTNKIWSRDDVMMLLGWVMGDLDTISLRDVLELDDEDGE